MKGTASDLRMGFSDRNAPSGAFRARAQSSHAEAGLVQERLRALRN